MSICWLTVIESDEEEIETVRIEQPKDYVSPETKLSLLGFLVCCAGVAGAAWLVYCVLARVAN